MEPLLTLLRRAAQLVLLMAPMAVAQDPLDVSAMLGSGTASVTTSAYDIGSPGNAFDGNTNSLLRSAAVNPLQVTLAFDTPQPVNGFGVWFLAGDNEWKVEGAQSLADLEVASGSYRLLVPWQTNG